MKYDEVGTVNLPVDQEDPRGVWRALTKITYAAVVATLGECDADGARAVTLTRKGGKRVDEILGFTIVNNEWELRRWVRRWLCQDVDPDPSGATWQTSEEGDTEPVMVSCHRLAVTEIQTGTWPHPVELAVCARHAKAYGVELVD